MKERDKEIDGRKMYVERYLMRDKWKEEEKKGGSGRVEDRRRRMQRGGRRSGRKGRENKKREV